MQTFNLFPSQVFTVVDKENLDKFKKILNSFTLTEPNTFKQDQSLDTYVLNKLPKLKIKIEKYLKIYVEEILKIKNLNIYVTQSWINVNKPGCHTHEHTHSNSLISGIYYFEGGGAPLKFMSRNYGNINMNYSFDLKEADPLCCNQVELDCIEGGFYFFPSSLPHSVDNSQSKQIRKCLSFNTFFEGSIGNLDNKTKI